MGDGKAGEIALLILIACTGFGLIWLLWMWVFHGNWTYSKEEREQIKRANDEKKLLDEIRQEGIESGKPPVKPKISPKAEKIMGIVVIILAVIIGII